MAYSKKEMERITNGPALANATSGGTLGQFAVKTADAKATVRGSGYFNAAIADHGLAHGDQIFVTYGVGGTLGGCMLIASISGGTVTTVLADVT